MPVAREFNPAQHPLGPPSLSNNRITVDLMLRNPTRITNMIRDLTLQRFIADRLFASGGGVSGGAVVYDIADANDLYPTRDVEEVEPGAEHPLITSDRPVPSVAQVRKYGGKTFIVDEAKDRNDAAAFTNEVRKLSNTIVRKINALCVGVLDAAASSFSRTISGHSWGSVITVGSTPTASANTPLADFAAANLKAAQEELGYSYNIWIVNPIELNSLIIAYGDRVPMLLQASGITEMYASNRVTAGTAYAAAEGQVGELRIEKPLGTETWREQGTERTWVQSNVRPVMFVNNPPAFVKFTGLT